MDFRDSSFGLVHGSDGELKASFNSEELASLQRQTRRVCEELPALCARFFQPTPTANPKP